MVHLSRCQHVHHPLSSRPSGKRLRCVCVRSRRWLITIFLHNALTRFFPLARAEQRLCMLSTLCSFSSLGSDCCHMCCGAACEGQHIIRTSPSAVVMGSSHPRRSWLAVAAYGFMPPRWEKCKGCARSLPGCINACL